MHAYKNDFNEALARATSLGFPRIALAGGSNQVTEAQGLELMELLQSELGGVNGLRPEDVAFRCGQVSARMARHVKSVAGLDTVLTLGTVRDAGVLLWDLDSRDLHKSMRAGKYHVWLTTPALEVLDFTLLVSVRTQRNLDLNRATPIAGDPNHLQPYQWLPVVAGTEAVQSLLQIT